MAPVPSSPSGPTGDYSPKPEGDLAQAFYQTVRARLAQNPSQANTLIESALATFCDDFSLLEARRGNAFHPSLTTLSRYLSDSESTNYSDLEARFHRGRFLIKQFVTQRLGTSDTAVVARQVAEASFTADMGVCLTKRAITTAIEDHYLTLKEHHIEPFRARTEASLTYLRVLEQQSEMPELERHEAQARLILDCEAAATQVKGHLLQWGYLLERHYPILVSGAMTELKELAPEITEPFRKELEKNILSNLREHYCDVLSQIIQDQTEEITLCLTAIRAKPPREET